MLGQGLGRGGEMVAGYHVVVEMSEAGCCFGVGG